MLNKLVIKIKVMVSSGETENEGNSTKEHTKYLLSIITVFVAGHYGQKAGENRRGRNLPPKRKTKTSSEKKATDQKSIMVLLYTDKNRKEILEKRLRCTRWTYSRYLDAIQKGIEKKKELCNIWLNSKALSDKSPE
jgi:hypothetical protein